jgi:multiple sugar transport system permease protein
MNRRPFRRWLLLGTAVVAAATLLLPVYWIFVTSVLPTSLVLSRDPPLLLPLASVSLDAYAGLFARKPMLTWVANSVIVTASTMAVTLIVSAMAGYSLSRFRTRAQQIAGLALLVSKMLPPTLIVIPFFILFSVVGLIETRLGLVLANTAAAVPFTTWMLKGFFDAIPRELEQAAMIDGCSELMAFRRVVLPLARPGLAAGAAYVAIITWADLLFARTLMSQPENWLVMVGLQSFMGEYSVDWASLSAASIVSVAPVMLLFFLLEPFLVKGMAQGSLAN